MSSPTFTAHSDHLAFYAGLAAEGVLNSVTRCEDAAGALAEPLRIFRCAVALAAQKWNEEHSQIRRLPIEILAYCFSFFDSIIDKVTVASRVCSHWRSVALHSPPLWFEIDLLRGVHGAQAKILHALPALLERSKGQPVSLVACVTTTSDVATLAHCLEDHLTHIRHLDISDNSTTTNNIGFTGFWTPAPILESLKYDGAIAIHGSLFSGFCPLLQSVDLGHPSVVTPCAVFHGVTQLSVTAPRAEHDAHSITTLLHMLPQLSRLVVRRLRDPQLFPVAPVQNTLRRLESLVITSDYRHSTAILRLCDMLFEKGWTKYAKSLILDDAFDARDFHYNRLHTAFEALTIRPGRVVGLTPRGNSRDIDIRCPALHPISSMENFLGGNLSTLDHLTLYANLTDESFVTRYEYTGKLLESAAVFPRGILLSLSSLTLLFGTSGPWSVLDPEVMYHCGTLRAPALRTLRIARAPEARDEYIKPLCPRALALFISHHLEFETDQLPSLVVDGIVFQEDKDDEAARDVLESYVEELQYSP